MRQREKWDRDLPDLDIQIKYPFIPTMNTQHWSQNSRLPFLQVSLSMNQFSRSLQECLRRISVSCWRRQIRDAASHESMHRWNQAPSTQHLNSPPLTPASLSSLPSTQESSNAFVMFIISLRPLAMSTNQHDKLHQVWRTWFSLLRSGRLEHSAIWLRWHYWH